MEGERAADGINQIGLFIWHLNEERPRHPSNKAKWNLLRGNGVDKPVIEQGQFNSVIVAFEEDVVRIELAVNDAAGVQITRRLRHLSRNTNSRTHPVHFKYKSKTWVISHWSLQYTSETLTRSFPVCRFWGRDENWRRRRRAARCWRSCNWCPTVGWRCPWTAASSRDAVSTRTARPTRRRSPPRRFATWIGGWWRHRATFLFWRSAFEIELQNAKMINRSRHHTRKRTSKSNWKVQAYRLMVQEPLWQMTWPNWISLHGMIHSASISLSVSFSSISCLSKWVVMIPLWL